MRNGSIAETISQISDAVEVLQPTVTSIVRKFSDRGLLQVASSVKNCSQRRVSVTAEGATLIGKLQAASMSDVLACFSDCPEEKHDTFADQISTFHTQL